MMFDPAHLALLRQQVFEMASPACRVFALAISTGRCPIEDRFNPAPHPSGSLGLHCPDRLERLHDEPDVDGLHRQPAERGIDISAKRARPLGGMFRISPARFVRGDIAIGAVLEGHRLGCFEPRTHPLGPAHLDRVAPIQSCFPAALRLLASLSKPDGMQGPEPHFTEPAGFTKAKDPGLRPARPYQQIEPAAVPVIATLLRP